MNKQFGKYRLLDKIAMGGMAEIWLARQTGVKGFEKLVVLKKILPEFTKNREFVDMFLNEARVAAMLTHSNIVQIYDLGSVQNIYFIAMEYIFGLSLDQLLIQSIKKGSPLPLQFSCHIISQSATGLHYAHNMKDIYGVSMNIVHRDISPQNILISYEGVAKVVDFGIAKANTRSSEETKAGKIKGKVSYMSPEQIRGEKLDGRSDVFALAIVLYEITTGKRLFPNVTNPFEMMDLMINKDFIPPHILNPRYPQILSKIIMKALHKDKEKRYQTALLFSNDLERFLKSFETPVFANDISIWLKKTFQDIIIKTKERHENLLWEDDDEKDNDYNNEDEETTNLLLNKVTPTPPKSKSKPNNSKVKYSKYEDQDEEKTVIGKPNFNSTPPKSFNSKHQDNDFFDFPDEKDFPDYKPSNNLAKEEEESTFKLKKEVRKKETRKARAQNIEPIQKGKARAQNIEPIQKPTSQNKKIKTKQKKKKPNKLIGLIKWVISKAILIFLLYSLFFMGVFVYKYISTEQRFNDIMENAIKQPDQELSVRKSIEFFCKNNEEVKCVKDTFNVKIDKFKGHINYVISYQIEGKFLTKWPIKIKMNSEKNSNSM